MRKAAQNSSSLDSDPLVENFVDDFAADGPLFAELFNPIPIEVDENVKINIMDSEDEMEQYFNGERMGSSGSESESSVEVSRPKRKPVKKAALKVKFPNLQEKTKQDNDKLLPETPTGRQLVHAQTGTAPVVTRVEVIEPIIKTPRTNKSLPPPVVVIETKDDKDEDDQIKRDKAMNKNAIMARENRQKKKQYIQNLERNCEKMQTENFALKSSLESKDKQLKSMAKEIEYLRSVIANETGLSALLKNIQNTSGLNFMTSFGQNEGESSQVQVNKRSADSFDCSSQGEQVKKKRKTSSRSDINNGTSSSTFEGPPTPCASPEPQTSGGVCLHVSNNNVSLEFCASCATSASEVWKVAGDHNYNRAPIKPEPCDDMVPIKPEPCDNSNYVVVKQEVADYVVVKAEHTNSDEEN